MQTREKKKWKIEKKEGEKRNSQKKEKSATDKKKFSLATFLQLPLRLILTRQSPSLSLPTSLSPLPSTDCKSSIIHRQRTCSAIFSGEWLAPPTAAT